MMGLWALGQRGAESGVRRGSAGKQERRGGGQQGRDGAWGGVAAPVRVMRGSRGGDPGGVAEIRSTKMGRGCWKAGGDWHEARPVDLGLSFHSCCFVVCFPISLLFRVALLSDCPLF